MKKTDADVVRGLLGWKRAIDDALASGKCGDLDARTLERMLSGVCGQLAEQNAVTREEMGQ